MIGSGKEVKDLTSSKTERRKTVYQDEESMIES